MPAWLKTWRGDGVIARLHNRTIAEAVRQTGLPLVDVLGTAACSHAPLVHVDNAAIGRMAAEHLLDRGFRRFGFCGFPGLNWAQQRRDSFVATLRKAGCPCKVYRMSPHTRSDSSWEARQEHLAGWMNRLPKPAGILACYDPVGQKVLDACRRVGVPVPEQVAVVGVDNDETVCDVCNPPLSSVIANHMRVGYEAAALLDRLMRGRKPPKKPIYIKPTGVATRLSSDVLAVGDPDVAAALAIIHQRACDGLSVCDVVQHVSVSRSTLKCLFRRMMGRSIHEEIIHTQLRRAQDLLAQGDLPLGSVAHQAGFRHQEYMGVVFRRRLGKTPGQYRRETQVQS